MMTDPIQQLRAENREILDEANKACSTEPSLAEQNYRRFIEVSPEDPVVLFNLGKIVHSRANCTEDLQEAASFYERAVVSPFSYPKIAADAMNNLGLMAATSGRTDLAGGCYARALLLDDTHVAARINYADWLRYEGDVKGAVDNYDEALKIKPDSAEARFASGMLALLLGDYKKGWKDYRARWQCPTFESKPFISPRPEWNGEDLTGKIILLTAEQGFGDQIMFIRYARVIKDRWPSCRVIALVHPALVTLFESVDGLDAAMSTIGTTHVFDYHIPLLTIPDILGQDYRWRIPYITRIGGTVEHGKHIGIVWAGSPKHGRDKLRSVEPEMFQPIIDRFQDWIFYSFQVGPRQNEVERLKRIHAPKGKPDAMDGWQRTSFYLSTMRLIITVDTAVAHLAGAMGIPVWVLLPSSPDWRWGLSGEKTHWYPTMRLFRQAKAGTWDDVFAKVAEELEKL